VPRDPSPDDLLAREISAAWRDIATAKLDSASGSTSWRNWLRFCSKRHLSPTLDRHSDNERLNVLLAFAVTVRNGNYSRKRVVQAESAEKAVRLSVKSGTWTTISPTHEFALASSASPYAGFTTNGDTKTPPPSNN
jgi:hypothetical protein